MDPSQDLYTSYVESVSYQHKTAKKPLIRIEIDGKRLVKLAAIVLFFGIFVALVMLQVNTQVPAQILLAHYAKARAGEPIMLDVGYVAAEEAKPTWGITTNSEWLAHYVPLIVPFFAYEGIAEEPIYPNAAVFTPYVGVQSFHIAGSMDEFTPERYVFLNERYILDPEWADERDALATLVHELTHVQGGNFLYIDERESYTAAATTEILAAMCNYGDKVACGAFWLDISAKARHYVHIVAHRYGFDWLYKAWSGKFFVENPARNAKFVRFAVEHGEEDLYTTIEKYEVYPYKRWIVPGVAQDWTLESGTGTMIDGWWYYTMGPPAPPKPQYMKYDDTTYLLGLWKWIFLTGYLR